MAAKTVKMCDLPGELAAKVFIGLNPNKIKLIQTPYMGVVLATDCEPKNLIYPDGWYYAKGTFRNKDFSSTLMDEEIRQLMSDGTPCSSKAPYCTLYCD